MDVTCFVTLILLGMAGWHFVWVKLGLRHVVRPLVAQIMVGRSADEEVQHTPRVRSKVLVSEEKRNGETSENVIATVKNEGNDPFHFPDPFTGLAHLVRAKKVGETEALKLACGVNPGKSPQYIAARDQLHAALAALSNEPTYRPLDEDLQPTGKAPQPRRRVADRK